MSIAVSDAGPLIALAKIDVLSILKHLFDEIWVTPSVVREAVEAGEQAGARDAAVISAALHEGWIRLKVANTGLLPHMGALGSGELSSISLALAHDVDWLLLDDADARMLATTNISLAGAKTQIKGTLGILVTAYQGKLLDTDQAITAIEALKGRPDIWISLALCDQVLSLIRNG